MERLLRRANPDGSAAMDIEEVALAQHMAMAAMIGIAWYNCIELNISVYMTFKRKRGLYFWSVLASIQGVMIHTLAFVLTLYSVIDLYSVNATLITIGWYLMVTGQSLVLYSRLHLIVKEKLIVRGVLAMIIWNAVTLHIPTTVLTYGSNSPSHRQFYPGFHIMEKIQMTVFCVQEFIISGIYIWGTLRFLRPMYRRHTRSVMLQLLWINVIIIIMDVAMLTMEYLENYSLQVIMKSAIYSVKLKLEFAVLNQLMRLAQASRNRNGISEDVHHTNSHSGHSSGAQTGFRGFLRRIIPRPPPSAMDDAPTIVKQRNLQDTITAGHNRQNQHMYESTVTTRAKDAAFEETPSNGITLTREVMQVSLPREARKKERADAPASLWYSAAADERTESLDITGDGLSTKSSFSQMELVTLNSPSSDDSEKKITFVDDSVDAPLPSAQPKRSSRAGTYEDGDVPYLTGDYGHQRPPRTLQHGRPSVANLKGGDGGSEASSEVRLHMR